MDDLINGLHESYYRLYIDTLEPPDLRVIVSLSSGCSSAVAAERALAKYGHDKVDLVFCDVQREDEDNWRFMVDL
jgi:CheY-like chemotaxis protein